MGRQAETQVTWRKTDLRGARHGDKYLHKC